MPQQTTEQSNNPLLEQAGAESESHDIMKPEESQSFVTVFFLFRLCIIGVLANFAPGEPYLTRYLIENKVHNLEFFLQT